MKHSQRHLFLFILIIALAMTACNASATPAPSTGSQEQTSPSTDQNPADTSAPGLDACVLLTKADAEAILGQAVSEPEIPIQGSEIFTISSCKYRVQGGGAFDNATLIISVPVNGDLQTAQNTFAMDKSNAQTNFSATPVDVPGLGDAAYWVGGTYGNQLGILKGNIHLILTAGTQKGDTPPQPIIDLAQTILSRLP